MAGQKINDRLKFVSLAKRQARIFFYFKRIGDTISCSGLPHFKTLMGGTIFWVQVRLIIGLSFLDHPQILQSILSQKLISCLSSGLPFFQCSSLDLVPSTTFSSGPSFFSVAVLSGLCLLVGNLCAMRFSYVCFHSILISAPRRLAEIWKLSQRRVTGGIGGWIQIPETWVLVLRPFLLCCQNAPQSLLAGYYHSYPLG